jgi:Ca2+-binding EF-hand superfamily protein
MKKFLIGGAAAALAVAIGPAFAQSAPPPGVAPGTTPLPLPAPGPQARMRFMTNSTLTRDEVVGHVRDMFARLDTNRDGYITREEMDAVHQKMMGMHGDFEKRIGERRTADRSAMFDKLDANHDGSISRQEFMAAQSQIHERRVVVMRESGGPEGAGAPGGPDTRMRAHGMSMGMGFGGRMFDMADANHDGRVSLAEAQTAALAHFDKADLNHDGKLTPEERQQAHELRRGQRRPS